LIIIDIDKLNLIRLELWQKKNLTGRTARNVGTIGHVDHVDTLTAAITMVLAKKGLSEIRILTQLIMLLKKRKGITLTLLTLNIRLLNVTMHMLTVRTC